MKPETIPETLIAAGLKIAKPETWTQGALARRKSGAELQSPASAYAVSWDAFGAVYAVLDLHPARNTGSQQDWRLLIGSLAALSLAASRLYQSTVEGVNDTLKHEDVLALFRGAIRRERGQL